MNYICAPGLLQLRWFNKCISRGIDPHTRITEYIRRDLVELGDNSMIIDELERQKNDIEERLREERKKQKKNNGSHTNDGLDTEITVIADHIMDGYLHNGRIPTLKYIYLASNVIATKKTVDLAKVLDRLETILRKKFDNIEYADYLSTVLKQVAIVRKKGENGKLTSLQIEGLFNEKISSSPHKNDQEQLNDPVQEFLENTEETA